MPSDREVLARLSGGELRELLEMLTASDIEELELAVGGTRLLLRRDSSADSGKLEAVPAPGDSAVEGSTQFIVADRVGFFHFPAGPGDSVNRPGARIGSGQVVGSIDSLNVAVPLHAPFAGRILEVLVEDGQPVEYGQPLLVVGASDGAEV